MSKSIVPVAFLGFAVTALSPGAHAQVLDFAPEPLRILSDPAYLPTVGQFSGVTGYDDRDATGTAFDDTTGARLFALHQWADEFTQSLQYGITDDISVNASIGYDPFEKTKQDFAAGGETSFKASGWEDPSFGVTWRAVDQTAAPLNLDFFGSYSPDWISARAANTLENGTVARGGQAGTVGAAVSRVTRGFTVYGSFAANFLGQRTVDDPIGAAQIETDARTNYTLALDTQTRFDDRVSLNAGVSHVWVGDANVLNTANNISHLNQAGDSTGIDLALNYHVVPNALVASLTYGHEFVGQEHDIFPPASGGDNTSLHNRDANLYGAKLSYAFP